METDQEDEIEALKAIFCKEGELETNKGQDGHQVTIYFQFQHITFKRDFDSGNTSVTVSLPSSYPQKDLPVITLKCTFLSVNTLLILTGKIQERANSLLGEAMLMNLFFYAQELLEEEAHKYLNTKLELAENIRQSQINGCCVNVKPNLQESIDKSETSVYDTQAMVPADDTLHDKLPESTEKPSQKVRSRNDSKTVTCVLQLDHMRSKQSYTKLIKKWILELGLTGRLCFCQKIILIILQGNISAVKEYIVKNRTTNVDVDSKGRSCKERMLTVLCEIPCDINTKFQDFAVLDLQTPRELQVLFSSSSMGDVYKEYVIDQLGLTHSKSADQRHEHSTGSVAAQRH
ncbi:unnamed protein product [Lymnaea stagnalis]|uniref:RWD domain-containing protein 3 n=1 Tax=Lymnaea stagnalis TaxID=6523 RepID=A0AAV2HX66_LYMST